MKRQEFLAGSCACALAAGAAPGRAKASVHAQSTAEREAEMKKFKEQWLATLMADMEGQLDVQTRTKLMETCGRACARRGPLYKLAVSNPGDVRQFVQALAKFLGKVNVVLEGRAVRLIYPKCYCELVADGPARLPDVYCCCSQGWVKEMFSTAAGKPVGVEALTTIKRGGDACRFVITFSE